MQLVRSWLTAAAVAILSCVPVEGEAYPRIGIHTGPLSRRPPQPTACAFREPQAEMMR